MSQEAVVATDELIHSLKKGKHLHDIFAQRFRDNYLIAGKLMHQWRDYFHIYMAPDINPHTCKDLDIRIIELHQEASFLKAEAEARLSAYKGASADKYRVQFAALVAEHKQNGGKLPAAATLSSLAEYAIADVQNAMLHAEIELAFWKEVLSDLANARKLLENITINLGIDAKTVQQEKYLDKLNTRNY